jgi:hypothetical protein
LRSCSAPGDAPARILPNRAERKALGVACPIIKN